jgi:hypothetical protein
MATETQIVQDDGQEPDETQAPDVEQSFIDQLRARRTAIAAETSKEFDIPGYDGMLKATYRRLGYEEVMKIARRAIKSELPMQELGAQADFLIRACTSIDAEGKHLAAGYNAELAAFFGIDTKRARDCLFHVFGNELAVVAHQTAVLRWMQAGESDISEEFQGE